MLYASSEFKVKSVGLSLSGTCEDKSVAQIPTLSSAGPIVRNQLDYLAIPVGSVFKYKIPKDMFYSDKGSQSIELDLDLLTIEGKTLPSDGFLSFNQMTQEILAFISPNDARLPTIRRRKEYLEYMLVARDLETRLSATEAFTIDFVEEEGRRDGLRNAFDITMTLTPNTENEVDMSIDLKIALLHRIAINLFSDGDASAIQVISFRRAKYAPGYHLMQQDQPLNKREVHSDHNHDPPSPIIPSYASYYEIVLTNKSLMLDPEGASSKCPVDVIEDSIIRKIFKNINHHDIDSLSRFFDPEYRLLHISFKPLASCVRHLETYRTGEEPVAVMDPIIDSIPKEKENKTRSTPGVSQEPTPSLEDEDETDIYMTTIMPAMIIVAALLLISFILICCLTCFRRRQEKARFEVISGRGGYVLSGSGDYISHYGIPEREAFLKGRNPVVFEQEMQPTSQSNTTPYGFYSPVIMPPPINGNGVNNSPSVAQTSTSMSHHYLSSQNNSGVVMMSMPNSQSHYMSSTGFQQQQQHLHPQPTPPTPHHHTMHQVCIDFYHVLIDCL